MGDPVELSADEEQGDRCPQCGTRLQAARDAATGDRIASADCPNADCPA